MDRNENRANSLAHLELARRTGAIVITFNYRIGLLGFLPYVDLEDQPSSGQPTRLNHALWDQVGLLHWVRHNVAHFGGESTNVSLLAGDSSAAADLQLLAMSPQAKGLFKRIILIHDDDYSATELSKSKNLDDYFTHLFGLAQRARQLQRKLVSELGLILERDQSLNEAVPKRSNDENLVVNYEIDRRVSKFLKTARIEQLARAEQELAKVIVSQYRHQNHLIQPSRFVTSKQVERARAVRLVDLLRAPSLDDKLLFPYFSHLIRSNQTLAFIDDGEISLDDKPSTSFWPSLAASLDEQLIQQAENFTSAFQMVQIEADYCRYVQQLYFRLFATIRDNELDGASLVSAIKRADPYKLIPRLSDHHQSMMAMAATATTAMPTLPSNETTKVKLDEASLSQQQSSVRHFSKWHRRNKTANALEFYHLRHAHLLQHLFLQRLDTSSGKYSFNNSVASKAWGSFDSWETSEEDTNVRNNGEDEDEEGDNLITRLQKQQQRSIMIMQHQQSGHEEAAGFSRNKRDSHDGQALATAGQQLVELLGSFDLLISFSGDALVGGQPDSYSSGHLLNQLTARNKVINPALLSYLQLADVHYLASVRTAPGYLNSLCKFSRSPSRVGDHRTGSARRRSFVLVADQSQRIRRRRRRRRRRSLSEDSIGDIQFLNNDPLLDRISHFALSGFTTSEGPDLELQLVSSSNSQKPYDTLNRRLDWMDEAKVRSSNGQRALVSELTSVSLDLVAYLKWLPQSHRMAISEQQNHRAVKQFNAWRVNHPLKPPMDLFNCLSELDSIIDSERNNHLQPSMNQATLTRLNEEVACLVNATNKLRLLLRANAAEELNPLIKQFYVINEQRYRKQLAVETGASEQQLTEKLSSNQKRVSPMMTRNLVNQSEGLYLDQLSSSMTPSSVVADQTNHHQPDRNGMQSDEQTRLDSAPGLQSLVAHTGQPQSGTTGGGGGGGIRGFFAKTYKDAVGQALGIVVGTGLLIFLLNLAIVLVIAIRSRRNLRGDGAHSRRSVADSSTVSGPIIESSACLELKDSTSAIVANGASNLRPNCERFHHLAPSTQQMDGSIDIRRMQTSSLISSFIGAQESEQQQQQQQLQASVVQPRSSLSSTSQRANKSIKFDLSGSTTCDRLLVKSASCQNHKGIMKQPAMTSDEDDILATDTVFNEAHQHHIHAEQQQSPASTADVDQYNQMDVSPASLDVIDLIPLDRLDCYDAPEWAEMTSSGDDNLTSGLKFIASGAAEAHHKCQAIYHHQFRQNPKRPQQQQQPQIYAGHKQSLASGSLTSPFASQSTHSTISASNTTQNAGVNFSPKRCLVQQQQQQQLAYFTAVGLNSPTSTLSSAPTPIFIAHHQHCNAHNEPAISGQVLQENDLVRTIANNPVMGLIYEAGGQFDNTQQPLDARFRPEVDNQTVALSQSQQMYQG